MSSGGGASDPEGEDVGLRPLGAAPEDEWLSPQGITLRLTRRPGQFSVPLVFNRAWATFRAAPFLILSLALLVFVPISLLDAAVGELGHHLVESDPFDVTLQRIAELLDLVVDVFGFAFFGGLLDHLVGRIHHGHEAHRPDELARQFSYGRLIGAALLFNLAVLVGVTFLVLPGLVAFTLFAFVGPIINIERVRVVDAFRRSYRVTRHFLIGVVCTVTIPFMIEQYADDWVEGLSIAHGFRGEFGTGVVLSLLGTGVVVMFEVCTAYQLLEIESERKGTPGPSHHTAT